jgi:hypothetical protein
MTVTTRDKTQPDSCKLDSFVLSFFSAAHLGDLLWRVTAATIVQSSA